MTDIPRVSIMVVHSNKHVEMICVYIVLKFPPSWEIMMDLIMVYSSKMVQSPARSESSGTCDFAVASGWLQTHHSDYRVPNILPETAQGTSAYRCGSDRTCTRPVAAFDKDLCL